jgi:hypothetical protein
MPKDLQLHAVISNLFEPEEFPVDVVYKLSDGDHPYPPYQNNGSFWHDIADDLMSYAVVVNGVTIALNQRKPVPLAGNLRVGYATYILTEVVDGLPNVRAYWLIIDDK